MQTLTQSSWERKKFRDICYDIEYGITTSAQDYGDAVFLRITDIDETGKINGDLKYADVSEKDFEKYGLRRDDVLIARSGATAGKPYIHKIDERSVFGSYLLRLQLKKEFILPDFVFIFLFSDNYLQQLKAIKIGSAQPNVNTTNLKTVQIPLPPLDEQERIVALFRSIEQSIVQVEGQEKNLKLLQKTLSNGLVSVPPVFGNLLAKSQTSEVSKTSEVLVLFGDVVECIEEHDKKPLEHGLTRFVGLENIEPENFSLQGFGNIEDGTTFTKRFAKGDVLFGKRRAYLKKVAVADYDGICSSDILVFRAIEKEILPELLPYYVSSDTFMNLAVSTSAGSLSPRTKWRDLAGFQLFLPDVKIQEKMVDVFNQLRQSLRLLSQQKETLKTLKQKLLNEILG